MVKYTYNAWGSRGLAHEKDIPVLSDIAESTTDAGIDVGKWDTRSSVNIGTVLLGLLGL